MPNTIKCGQCALYAEQLKPQPGNKPAKSLHRGHCLNRTIYAVKKHRKQEFPPGAQTAIRRFNQHKIVSVREDAMVPHCTAAKPKME